MNLKASRASSSVVALLLPRDSRACEEKNSKEKQSNVIASAMGSLQERTWLLTMLVFQQERKVECIVV